MEKIAFDSNEFNWLLEQGKKMKKPQDGKESKDEQPKTEADKLDS